VIELACTVRGCAARLNRVGSTLRCAAGHAFDQAREGYWNLLQAQDRRSPRSGDSRSTVEARRRWLARGYAVSLAGAIAELAAADALGAGQSAVDLGCGDGYFTRRLLEGRKVGACGIDLSVAAVRLAARQWPAASWVVGNADRFVPLRDATVDLALSIFGRRPAAELARILRPRGRLVIAVPAEDDLVELRQAVLGRGPLRERAASVIQELRSSFRLVERRSWRERVVLERSAIDDGLAMTYRGGRRRERERLSAVQQLEVTLAAELLLFARAES